MFDFNSAESPKKLNRDFILSKITDAMIFSFYFGPFDLKTLYPSRFQAGKHGDRKPSTGFYVSKSGKLIYNHLNGREEKMDAFAFVCKLYNISFSDALKRVAADFGLVSGIRTPEAEKAYNDSINFDKSYKKQTLIHFEIQKFDDAAKEFWKSYHINSEELKREKVYQIKKLFINETLIPNDTSCLRFALTTPHNSQTLTKVYSPGGEDTLKWVSNIPLDVPFGLDTLKKPGKFCIISKAVKDMIILKKFLPSVIATQNESKAALSDKVLNKLRFNFHDIYIAWDNDDTGNEAMDEMEALGCKSIRIPEEYYTLKGIKDWSDVAKETDLDEVKYLLNQNGLI